MKIAIVSAFSEPCLVLMQSLLTSCYQAFFKCEHDFSVYCYKCNYNNKLCKSTPFESKALLPIWPDTQINLIESTEIEWHSKLPDIAIYDHFSKNFINNFDYTLFCHDDIVLNDKNVFDEMITLLNDSDKNYDLIAGVLAKAGTFLSMRFAPSFLFIPTITFTKRNLSFTYQKPIGNTKEFHWYNNTIDGGAQLFASYYNKQNQNNTKPFTQIEKWFKHAKIGQFGMEFSRIAGTDQEAYQKHMKETKRKLNHNFEMQEF